MIKRFIQHHKTLITYGLIGVSAALVDLFFFFYCYRSLGIRSSTATVISMGISMCYGFTMNIVYNFNVYDRLLPRFLSYAAVSLVGVLLSAGSLLLFSETLGASAGLVKVVTLPLIFAVQYLLNRTFSFAQILGREDISTLKKSYL